MAPPPRAAVRRAEQSAGEPAHSKRRGTIHPRATAMQKGTAEGARLPFHPLGQEGLEALFEADLGSKT